MNNDMRSYVINLLETYQERTRKIALLHYELEHPARTSEAEIISAMALGHGAGGSSHTEGHISDKTLYIALNYQSKVDKLNADTKEEIVVHLVALEQEQKRLDYYISLLESSQAEVIHLSYFERLSQEKVAESLDLSIRTVQTLKAKALKTLTGMYQYVAKLN